MTCIGGVNSRHFVFNVNMTEKSQCQLSVMINSCNVSAQESHALAEVFPAVRNRSHEHEEEGG